MGTLVLLLTAGAVYAVSGPAVDEIRVEPEPISHSDEATSTTLPMTSSTVPQLIVGLSLPPDPVPSTIYREPTTTTESTTTTSADAEGQTDTDGGGSGTTSAPSSDSSSGASKSSGPVVISGQSGVVLDGMTISNPDGPCVKIVGSSDIVVRSSQIGPCGGVAVVIEDSSAVRLDRLAIASAKSGVYALDSSGISVTNSEFRDAGRNFVQFDKVTGAGNVISGNTGRNRLGGSSAEDFVSIYRSSGTSGSPLRVSGNVFRDGGPSTSGSGIMVGDQGGSNIVVDGNRLVNPGQAGIGVPGGTNIRVVGNTVYSAAHPWSNVGIYVWNQSGGSCGGIEVSGNRVEWYNAGGSPNPAWDGGGCGSVAGWDNNDWSADLG